MSFASRKARVGRVVSDKMDKTVVVRVEHRRAHRLYKKSIQLQKRYVAHDPENDARLGDLVRLIESRPISKTKRWRVASIIERGNVAEIQPGEIATESGAEPVLAPQAEAEARAEDTQPQAAIQAEPEQAPETEAASEHPEPSEEPEAASEPEAIQEPTAEAAQTADAEEAEPEPETEAAPAQAEPDEPAAEEQAEQVVAQAEPEAAPEAAVQTDPEAESGPDTAAGEKQA